MADVMTIKEATDILYNFYDFSTNGIVDLKESDNYDAVSLAVEALREKAEREANEPLTLDELRECCKVGTPIYVSNINGTPIFKGQISVGAVLDIIPAFGSPIMHMQAIYGRNLTLAEGDYGKSWLAYCHKKEAAQ